MQYALAATPPAPMSLTECIALLGTSQKVGKKPPCNVASVETHLPYIATHQGVGFDSNDCLIGQFRHPCTAREDESPLPLR